MAKFQSYGIDYLLRDYLTSLEFTLLTESQIAMAQAISSPKITKKMKDEYTKLVGVKGKELEISEVLLNMMELGGFDLNTINVNYDKVLTTLIQTPSLDYKGVQELPAVTASDFRTYIVKLLKETNDEIAAKNQSKKD